MALVLAAGPLTRVALEFGPVEFFALIMLGLSLLMGLAGKSMIKALMMSGAIKKAVATEDHKKRMGDMGLTIRYMDPGQYNKYWDEYEAMLKELLPLTKE